MTTRPENRRPSKVNVTFRKMDFGLKEGGFAKYWHDKSPFKSFFWGALSTAFPAGEKFFMDSARAFRDAVDDPELVEEIKNFCLQEAHHTYQHIVFNKVIKDQGFDMDKYEARFTKVLDKVREKLDPMGMLAVTAALEHFTAGFAHQYLANPSVSKGADPRVKALWAWHAAEESEHKGTCFDVFQKAGGEYRLRVGTLPVAWFLIVTITMRNLFDMLREDGKALNLIDIAKGLSYLFGPSGLITGMLPAFFAYFAKDFHPWNHDNAYLIAEWEASNSKYIAAGAS